VRAGTDPLQSIISVEIAFVPLFYNLSANIIISFQFTILFCIKFAIYYRYLTKSLPFLFISISFCNKRSPFSLRFNTPGFAGLQEKRKSSYHWSCCSPTRPKPFSFYITCKCGGSHFVIPRKSANALMATLHMCSRKRSERRIQTSQLGKAQPPYHIVDLLTPQFIRERLHCRNNAQPLSCLLADSSMLSLSFQQVCPRWLRQYCQL